VTGGTGSFGKRFIATVLERYKCERIVVYSRDELKQFEMAHQEPFASHPDQMRYFLGDIRDLPRMRMAMEGIDVVIHAAALKQVPAAEYNPFEFIKTNVIGAQNIIDACLDRNVKRVIALSTDKAAAPINLYGATKLCSDKLFIAANNYRGSHDIRLSVVRYGNVLGSRGSVIPFFLNKKGCGVIPVTDERMTRFSITLQKGVDFVLSCLARMKGGELYVPKIPSYKIMDVVSAVAPDAKVNFVGIRPGEKLHEEMITESDSLNTIEYPGYYIVRPSTEQYDPAIYMTDENGLKGTPVKQGFSYTSDKNTDWLSVNQLKEMIDLI